MRSRPGRRKLVVDAADREVDDVDAVGHGLVDGRDAVRRRSSRLPAADAPADLVGRDARARRDAADAAEHGRRAGGVRRRHCRRPWSRCASMTVGVARRVELVREAARRCRALPPQPALKYCAPISFWLQLEALKCFARNALAVPAWDLLVAELAVLRCRLPIRRQCGRRSSGAPARRRCRRCR